MSDTNKPEIDPFATQLIEPVSPSQLAGKPSGSRVVIRDANTGEIIVEADIDTDVIVDESSYYIDPLKVISNRFERTERTVTCPYKGNGFWLDLVDEGVRVRDAAWVYTDTNPDYEQFRDRIGFYSRNFRGTTVEIVSPNSPTNA